MPWQRDPQTNDWVMVDAPAPPQPATPPVADGGGYSHSGLAYPRAAEPTYQNEDPDARDRWLEENVFSRGGTCDYATGEILDGDGNVVGKLPSFYRVN